jgi:hypothetical protein
VLEHYKRTFDEQRAAGAPIPPFEPAEFPALIAYLEAL